ncbi:HNH endonuclease domain-containing protein [Lyngbya sp. PCC 8106]|uniref:HNH endonuclease domain-containing protein n=1 Tax=Lyngbya sp. (strain PCC 8106) TaxID=313612 RepID=UPI0000EA98EE|nr:HNH endonuclease domain-containing protein [Lyngbya sp. PCC 8106]EAW35203.1 hypothetical protein L8106_13850 [Lyngbya sp. PCC 8106]
MEPEDVISTILKHDRKVNTYKFALVRAINDVALFFPDLRNPNKDIAIPLKSLAQLWVAYYWPFVNPNEPILQGTNKIDIRFRRQLTELRRIWEQIIGGVSRPSDGFFLINELRISRKRQDYPEELRRAFDKSLKKIVEAVEQPIERAGPSSEPWKVFEKPIKYKVDNDSVVAIPGTQETDKCLIIEARLWRTFQKMSLWIEALCIHEWCLFSEKRNRQKVHRCYIYRLLTDRPDNRRSLDWEQKQVNSLLREENKEFICPWTEKRITNGTKYHLDHLLPLSLYPINELWNLVPADPHYNSHIKRDRLPSPEKLQRAKPHLERAYSYYNSSEELSVALKDDVKSRFLTVSGKAKPHLERAYNYYNSSEELSVALKGDVCPSALANAVVNFIDIVGESRNIVRF